MLTWLGLARRIAHEEGIKPATNAMLEYVMWEKTGFPCFFMGDHIEMFTEQCQTAFREMKEATNGNSN